MERKYFEDVELEEDLDEIESEDEEGKRSILYLKLKKIEYIF